MEWHGWLLALSGSVVDSLWAADVEEVAGRRLNSVVVHCCQPAEHWFFDSAFDRNLLSTCLLALVQV